jgi:hypothetical protein
MSRVGSQMTGTVETCVAPLHAKDSLVVVPIDLYGGGRKDGDYADAFRLSCAGREETLQANCVSLNVR